MGGGRYSTNDWAETKSLRSMQSTQQIFHRAASRSVHPDFDPKRITRRESRDSVDSPNARPILLGFDVTGSMGGIPDYFAREGVGHLMDLIYAKRPVADPHVGYCAIGDAQGIVVPDEAPFQMSQFEADNRVAETITNIWLEGGGAAQDTESYDLPWLFLSRKVEFDAWEKRGVKGIYFGVGDEPAPNRTYTPEEIRRVFGDQIPVEAAMTSKEMLDAAKDKWAIFQIIIEQGARGRSAATQTSWPELLGPNALFLDDYHFMPELVVATIQVLEGMDMEIAINGAGKGSPSVRRAFERVKQFA